MVTPAQQKARAERKARVAKRRAESPAIKELGRKVKERKIREGTVFRRKERQELVEQKVKEFVETGSADVGELTPAERRAALPRAVTERARKPVTTRELVREIGGRTPQEARRIAFQQAELRGEKIPSRQEITFQRRPDPTLALTVGPLEAAVQRTVGFSPAQERIRRQEVDTGRVGVSGMDIDIRPGPGISQEKEVARERRIRQLQEREQRLETFEEASAQRLGIERGEGSFLSETGKAFARFPIEFPSAIIRTGGRIGLALEALTFPEGRAELVRAGKEVPGVVIRSLDPRSPEGLANLAVTAFAIGGVARGIRTQRALSRPAAELRGEIFREPITKEITRPRRKFVQELQRETGFRFEARAPRFREVIEQLPGERIIRSDITRTISGRKFKVESTLDPTTNIVESVVKARRLVRLPGQTEFTQVSRVKGKVAPQEFALTEGVAAEVTQARVADVGFARQLQRSTRIRKGTQVGRDVETVLDIRARDIFTVEAVATEPRIKATGQALTRGRKTIAALEPAAVETPRIKLVSEAPTIPRPTTLSIGEFGALFERAPRIQTRVTQKGRTLVKGQFIPRQIAQSFRKGIVGRKGVARLGTVEQVEISQSIFTRPGEITPTIPQLRSIPISPVVFPVTRQINATQPIVQPRQILFSITQPDQVRRMIGGRRISPVSRQIRITRQIRQQQPTQDVFTESVQDQQNIQRQISRTARALRQRTEQVQARRTPPRFPSPTLSFALPPTLPTQPRIVPPFLLKPKKQKQIQPLQENIISGLPRGFAPSLVAIAGDVRVREEDFPISDRLFTGLGFRPIVTRRKSKSRSKRRKK